MPAPTTGRSTPLCFRHRSLTSGFGPRPLIGVCTRPAQENRRNGRSMPPESPGLQPITRPPAALRRSHAASPRIPRPWRTGPRHPLPPRPTTSHSRPLSRRLRSRTRAQAPPILRARALPPATQARVPQVVRIPVLPRLPCRRRPRPLMHRANQSGRSDKTGRSGQDPRQMGDPNDHKVGT